MHTNVKLNLEVGYSTCKKSSVLNDCSLLEGSVSVQCSVLFVHHFDGADVGFYGKSYILWCFRAGRCVMLKSDIFLGRVMLDMSLTCSVLHQTLEVTLIFLM